MMRKEIRTISSKILVAIAACFSFEAATASPFPPGLLQPSAPPKVTYDSIPKELNPAVRKWIRFFTHEDRERFDRFMERGARYRILVQEILRKNGVPEELYYLAMIESGYASLARSHAKATGIWQFMTPTARQYGLRVDNYVDERLDVIRATEAAAKYLKTLKREFGSWYLAMAAYNCGEGRVRKAIRRHGTKDFWKLAKRRALPAETIQYVPKFQAAMHIARNPARYGFDKKTHYEFPDVRRKFVPSRTPLAEVAKRNKVPVASLRALNPHVLPDRPKKTARGYHVWIPM